MNALLQRRRSGLTAATGIDWGHAEALALASLLVEDTPVRLTGQDVGRGTFSHRHMVLHDINNGQTFAPIQALPSATATLEVHNSPLSELACIGFEYGYALTASDTLVLWEAQYGDFVNGAQVMLDQFIAAGFSKWGFTSRLTLLLPHGYEGSGPEHSSGRVERFLQAAAEGEHPDRQLHHTGAVFPFAAAPGQVVGAAPAGRNDAKVVAAKEGSRILARRSDGRAHSRRCWMTAPSTSGVRRRGHWCCAAARSTTT